MIRMEFRASSVRSNETRADFNEWGSRLTAGRAPVVINGRPATIDASRSWEELRMDKRQSSTHDGAAIRDVVESWAAAVRRRDYEGILKNHSSAIVMFDVPPPFQSKGIEAYKRTWDLFFSCSGDPVVFDIASMNIFADSNVAFVIAEMHCTEPGPQGGRKELEFRLTIGLQKVDGMWTIVHEHHSVPALE